MKFCAFLLSLVLLLCSGCGFFKTMSAADAYYTSEHHQLEVAQGKCPPPPHEPTLKCDDPPVLVDRAPLKIYSDGVDTGIDNKNIALKDSTESRVANATTRTKLEHQFALMAVFSRMAYHRHIPEYVRYGRDDPAGKNLPPHADACNKNRKNSKHPHPIDYLYEKSESDSGRWQLWEENGEAKGCASKEGLFYETYVFKTPQNQITHAVIAFRGTENSSNQLGYDWGSNVSNFFGFEPSEFKLAQEMQRLTIESLLASNGVGTFKPIIYVTGHSLGGGLAQQAAYLHKDIVAAYVFDTSPITNWSNIYGKFKADGKTKLMENDDPLIYRIAMKSEFLSYLRWFTNRVTERRFGRSDYVFQYKDDGSIFGKHNMSILACKFAESVSHIQPDKDNKVKPAEFYFTPTMAKNLLANFTKQTTEDKNKNGEIEYFCEGANIPNQPQTQPN